MFITKKRHRKELEQANDLYLGAMKRVSEFHQHRDEAIMMVIGDWKDKFKNVSATKCMYMIEKILTYIPEEGKKDEQ